MSIIGLLVLCGALPAALARGPSEVVVGGQDAADGAWPWQLSHRNAGSHTCGTSLIGPNWSVSAAHCVGGAVAAYTIVAGTNKRSCSNPAECETRRVASVIRHADFQNIGLRGFPNDISLMNWEDPIFEVQGRIQYATRATTDEQVGWECYISGWGRMVDGGPLPENLQEALVDLLTVAECQAMWQPTPVTDLQVCIFDRATQARGACNGDSGGPLVCRASPASPWQLVGATSWGRTGCSTDFASVYTRISAYNTWITDNVISA